MPWKATNLALVEYDAARRLTMLLVTPKSPSSWDRCRAMSTQAQSCWLHTLLASLVPFCEECVGEVAVNVLLLQDILVRELYLDFEVLTACSLPEEDQLIVDAAVLYVVELVNVAHKFLTLILYKVLDNSISADGNTSKGHQRRWLYLSG